MALQDSTKLDMLRLQMYGALHLSGIQPTQIEAYLASLEQSQVLNAFEGVAGGDAAKIQADAQLVNSVTQGVASAVSSIPVVGSIIGLVTGVVGAAASSAMAAQALDKCDTPDSYHKPYADAKKLMTGYNAPVTYTNYHNMYYPAAEADAYLSRGDCIYNISTKTHSYSRHGALLTYTNDGSWFYKIPEGTVIGVIGKTVPGSLISYCEESYRGRPETPRINGVVPRVVFKSETPRTVARSIHGFTKATPDWLRPISELYRDYPWTYTKEYGERQRAVTLYLEWLTNNMDIGVLSCMERFLINTVIPSTKNVVIDNGTPTDPEFRHAQDGTIIGHRYASAKGDSTPLRRKLASRYHASIMSMFDVIMKTAQAIGRGRVAAIVRKYIEDNASTLTADQKTKAEKAAQAVLGTTKNGATDADIKIWPALPIANAMTYRHLVYTVQEIDRALTALGVLIQTGQPVYAEKDGKTIRLNAADLRLDARAPVQWIPTHAGPSIPVIVGGVAAAAVAAYLVWKALER